MLSNLHAIISKGYLAIEEKHDKLLTSLRTAYADELNLKKEQTSYSDLLDALRLVLKGYNIKIIIKLKQELFIITLWN